MSENADSAPKSEPTMPRILWVLVPLMYAFAIFNLIGNYAPYKDEDNYLANAAAWLAGDPMPTAAFSPIHALPFALLSESLQWPVGIALNIFWMALACLAIRRIAFSYSGGSRFIADGSTLCFALMPPVMFSALGMLAEPFALAMLLWGATLLFERERPTRLWLLGLCFVLSAASRIDYAFYTIGIISSLAIFGDRRWRLLVFAGVSTLFGFLIPPVVDSAMGADFAFFRGHIGIDHASDTSSLLRFGKGLFAATIGGVGELFWFPSVLRLAGVAGVIALAKSTSLERARPLLALLLASGLVFLMTDVEKALKGDGYLFRYFLLMLVPTVIGVLYLMQIVKQPAVRVLRVILLSALILVSGWTAHKMGDYYPSEYLALRDNLSEPLSDEGMAQRDFAGVYLRASPRHFYDGKLASYSPQDLARYARESKLDWILLSTRWEQVWPLEIDEYIEALTHYEAIFDSEDFGGPSKYDLHRLVLLRIRKDADGEGASE